MAKLDPLLAALISKLPTPEKPWPAQDRLAWLVMISSAFDVVYGVETVRIVVDTNERPPALSRHDHAYQVYKKAELELQENVPVTAPPRGFKHDGHDFYVAADGTVCNADATPVMMIDVPPEETIFDYRPVTGEFRDLDSIVWADGARGRAGLAEGVSFCGPG